MKALRKTQLSVALGAALATMAVAPLTAYGFSVVADGTPQLIVGNDGGDALIYPFYTTVGNNTTAFSLTNTYNKAIAVKVRFREQRYSMEVWDTIVFLSAGDKWDFFVKRNASGVPEVNIDPADETCTMVPPSGPNGNGFPTPFRSSSLISAEDWAAGVATVGHLEVIGMMDLTNAYVDLSVNGMNILDISLAQAIEAKNNGIAGYANLSGCDALRSVFGNSKTVASIQGAADAPNDLVGRWLINGGGSSGIEAGSEALPIQDLFGAAYFAAQSSELCSGGTGNCADGSFSGPAPTKNGVAANIIKNQYSWSAQQLDHPHLGDTTNANLANIDQALEAQVLIGDWSNNPTNDVGADWITSFVTRYAYIDRLDCNKADGQEWCYVQAATVTAPVTTKYPTRNPFIDSSLLTPINVGTPTTSSYYATPVSCLRGVLNVWDIDERRARPVASPDDIYSLCNEINVFTIALEGDLVRDSLIQQNTGPFARQIMRFESLDAERGWAELELLWPTLRSTSPEIVRSAATMGNLFILRNTASPEQNNATLTNLQKWTDDGRTYY